MSASKNKSEKKQEIVFKMPDRFKVTKTDAPDIDATYKSILKDDDAVLGKLLPPSTGNNESSEKKGKHSIQPFHF